MLETWAPTARPLVSGEPVPIVQVSSYEPVPLTVIEPPPIAVTLKSPAIAVDDTDELEELDELDALDELDELDALDELDDD
jgi:ribosome assembly protein YihI (activator of Der GTPase)